MIDADLMQPMSDVQSGKVLARPNIRNRRPECSVNATRVVQILSMGIDWMLFVLSADSTPHLLKLGVCDSAAK